MEVYYVNLFGENLIHVCSYFGSIALTNAHCVTL